MADVHTPVQRSYNMSRVRSKNTKPEMLVRKFLFSHGFRYRLHDKKLPGKPDLISPKYHTAIFILNFIMLMTYKTRILQSLRSESATISA